jgi:epsilon-lactone hydrolase
MALSLPPRVVRGTARATLGLPGLARMSPRMERRWLDFFGAIARVPKGGSVEQLELGGVPGTLTQGPWTESGRALLYLHGGAYCHGSTRAYRGVLGAISRATRARVYAPDYPLAPEHPFPAGPDGALAFWRALSEGSDGTIVVAGDSAGGGMALAMALRLRDAGEPLPAGLILFCPWVDLTNSGRSFFENGRREPLLRRERSNESARMYAAGAELDDPRLSPLFAADLSGLPPVHLQSAADDLHLSDADALAARLREAGADLEYRRFDGVWHDFQLFGEYLAVAREAIAAAGSACERFAGSVATGGAIEAAAKG